MRSSSSRMPAAVIASSSATVKRRRGKPSAAMVVISRAWRFIRSVYTSRACKLTRRAHFGERVAGARECTRPDLPVVDQVDERADLVAAGQIPEPPRHRQRQRRTCGRRSSRRSQRLYGTARDRRVAAVDGADQRERGLMASRRAAGRRFRLRGDRNRHGARTASTAPVTTQADFIFTSLRGFWPSCRPQSSSAEYNSGLFCASGPRTGCGMLKGWELQ